MGSHTSTGSHSSRSRYPALMAEVAVSVEAEYGNLPSLESASPLQKRPSDEVRVADESKKDTGKHIVCMRGKSFLGITYTDIGVNC